MPAAIDPEPPEEVREAILAALADAREEPSGWAEAALAEGIEGGDEEP